MTTLVSEIPAAEPQAALRHFEARLAFETDCWDVHESMKSGAPDFVLAMRGDRPPMRKATCRARSAFRTGRR